ncbi:MAG: alanine racemase, partial [Blastocatellia bacterium]
MDQRRPTWAEISLSALKHNYLTIRNHLTAPAQLMAVVKANAYGHGAVECARALEAAGADWFGVALVEEGIELRRAGIARPIFCLGGFWRGQADEVIAQDLTTAVYRLDQAEELNARAGALGRIVDFHLKVDTGMGRLGVQLDELAEFARALRRFDSVKLDGVMTHFAAADSDTSDYTELQIARYEEAVGILRDLGFDPSWRHLANSAGIHAYPQSHGNLARVGIAMYGLTRDALSPNLEPFDARAVMSLHSRI